MLIKIILGLVVLGMGGCLPSSKNTSWEQDCERNYSETAYDLQRCLDRQTENKRVVSNKPKVYIEPEETDRPELNTF